MIKNQYNIPLRCRLPHRLLLRPFVPLNLVQRRLGERLVHHQLASVLLPAKE
jgi:hypothetical protein